MNPKLPDLWDLLASDSDATAVLLCDERGIVVSARGPAAEILGREPVGGALADLAPPAGEAGAIQSAARRTWIWEDEAGEVRIVDVLIRPFPGGTVLVIEDVAGLEGRAYRDRLVERLLRLGDFVGSVTHELNNPLAGVIGYSQLLAHETAPEKRRRFLESVSTQAERCRRQVDALQVCSGTRPGRRERVSLADVARAALSRRRPRCEALGVDVRSSLVPGTCGVDGDPDLLDRAVGALLDNALDAVEQVPAGARTIDIEAGEVDRRVVLRIRDSGPGIRATDRDRVFEPSFTTHRSGSGTGLGLPMALSIARWHGGDVSIAPGPERGALVEIELLRAAPPPTPVPVTSQAGDAAPAAPAVRGACLCVDDDAFVLELYRELFDFLGAPLLTATDVDEARDVLERHEITLVICDYRLRGATAGDVLAMVQERWPDLGKRFVVATGEPTDPRVEAWRVGSGIRVLNKPFSVPDLQALLTDVGLLL